MNIFAALLVLCGHLALFVGFFVFKKNKKSFTNLGCFLFSICIYVWLVSYSIAYSIPAVDLKSIWFKIGLTGVIFIVVTAYHFNISFIKKERSQSRFITGAYCIGLFFVCLLWGTRLFYDGLLSYPWGYYPKAGLLHPLYMVFLFSLVSWYLPQVLLYYLRLKKQHLMLEAQRTKYMLLASFIFTFAASDFIQNYGVAIFPVGTIFVTLYLIVVAYAIVRYRLMDISLAITRSGIFVAVYSLVLGIPYALAFSLRDRFLVILGDGWWLAPMGALTVLATAGPFIYLYIQKKTEERLFQEQMRYQSTLRQASSGMGRIKDLKRLVGLIVHIVTRTVRLEHCMVYLKSDAKDFYLAASRSSKVRFHPLEGLDKSSPLIKKLVSENTAIVYDEIKQMTQDYGDHNLARVEKDMAELDGKLVVPSFADDEMIGVIVLGNKLSGKPFTNDDLNVFSILANQAALAIENAQFYEDMKKTHEQLFKAEKMATIGTMADGLSHQINNRLHALGFIAGDVLDTIKLKKDIPMSDEVKEIMVDIEHALNRVQENVHQGGEIVQGLLKYTRKGEDGFAEVNLDKLVDSAIEMTQFKIKPGEMTICRDYPMDLPHIKGNFTQLQEVLFNLIDNAYDAMMQRKTELKEEGYRPHITISAQYNSGKFMSLYVEDTGMGIKGEDEDKLFTPFFTTKASSKKGTGLGLYVIQKLIEENHGGKVKYSSVYKQGTKVHVTLPVAK